ncbi:MAG: phytoene/squalene synthase family protein [Xanthobacteraceae bacterium]
MLSAAAFAHCAALVRAADRDRFIATLFAPAERRSALHALYAFKIEIARVREVVRQPLAGEIRLQWWSDLLDGTARGDAQANPVALALTETIARYALPPDLLRALIEARRLDLYDEPMAGRAELESYAAGSSPILPAARILSGGDDPGIGPLAHHAGIASELARLLSAFPLHAPRAQLFVPTEVLQRHGCDRADLAQGRATPALRAALGELRRLAREHLAQAGALLATSPQAIVPALLPLAPVGATLKAMDGRTYDPFVPISLAPWRRQWLIWRAARDPERMFR